MPAPNDSPPDDRRLTLGEHLEELRKRLLWSVLYWAACAGVVAYHASGIMGLVLSPAMEALEGSRQRPRLVYLDPTSSFMVQFKVILIAGAFLASPFVARELWGFVASGLWGREKRLVRYAAPVSFLLFASGALFFYLWVQPAALSILFEVGRDYFPWRTDWSTEHMIDVEKFVSFFLWMSLAMGLVFQLPLVMFALSALGVTSAKTFSKYRRHFILGATIVAAVITPTGDAITLLLFMVPILALFEIGVLAAWIRERRSAR